MASVQRQFVAAGATFLDGLVPGEKDVRRFWPAVSTMYAMQKIAERVGGFPLPTGTR